MMGPMTDASRETRHRQRDPRVTWGVRGIALVAGLGAAVLTAAEPTGGTWADPLWRGGAVAVLVLLGSRAARWTWVWLAAVTAVAAVGAPVALAAALVALALATASSWFEHRPRLLGAGTCALAGGALLALPELGPHGAEVLVAAAAVGPALVTGFRASPTARKRLVVRTALVGGGLVVLGMVGAGVAAALSASSLLDGADQAEAGLDAVADGDQEVGAERFDAASASFDDASGVLAGPLTWPARALPVVAQHLSALSDAAGTGRDVALSAGGAARAAPYQELRAEEGQVDLARVEAMQVPLAEATAALEEASSTLADAGSPWLLPPVADALDRFATEVDDALPDARLASRAVDATPSLLGAEGDRRYLVLFTNPAESRNLGGFIGSYGMLEARAGQLEMAVSGSIADLAAQGDPADRTIDDEEFLLRYDRYDPTRYFQNLTASPDMGTTAEVSASMYEQTTGVPVDGVMVVDPLAIAALLELTGPVELAGSDRELGPDNAADFLLREQYELYESDNDRRDQLVEVGRATFDALTDSSLPDPSDLGAVLGPVVDGKHLMFFPFAAEEQELLGDLGALGRFGAVPGSDVLSVRSANLRANKIDGFLHRSVRYRAEVDPATGEVTAVATVTLRNDAPAEGLPEYVIGPDGDGDPPGTNRTYLALFTPLLADGATVDGEEVGLEPQRELGLNVYTAVVVVPPGGTRTLEVRLQGVIPGMDGTYRLTVAGQPLAHPDDVVVEIDPGGRAITGADGLTAGNGVLAADHQGSEDVRYRVTFPEP